MNPSLLLIPDRYKASKLYSQIPDSGAGDLAFTRALDTATRVNSEGLIEKVRTNLLTFSEQFDNAAYDKLAVTISENATTAPNGTLTADKSVEDTATSQHLIFRTITGSGRTLSFFAKAAGRNFIAILSTSTQSYFNISNGTLGTIEAGSVATITDAGNGWYRCTLTNSHPTFGMTMYLATADGTVTYTGDGTSGAFIWGAQLEAGDIATPYIPTTTAAVSVGMTANIPRIDYTGSGCGKLLLEPQRTNTAQFSEQINNAFWTKGNATISANVSATIDPSGFNGADKLQEDSSTDSHFFGNDTASATTGQAVTFSVFLKAAERSFAVIRLYTGASSIFGYYNLANGTLGTIGAGATGTIVSYGNGWYRCSLTVTMVSSSVTLPYVYTSTGNGVNSYTGTTGHGIFCFGCQQEVGSYPTSYIPTLGAAVTRSADAASKTGISALIGQTSGTIFIDVQLDARAQFTYFTLSPNLTVGTNYLGILIGNASIAFESVVGSALQAGITLSNSATGRFKIAAAYNTNDFVLYVNGSQVGTDTSGSVPACSEIGLYEFAQVPSLKYNTAALYTTRLDNATLATLTSL